MRRTDGYNYEQTCCEIFTIRDGNIVERHKFFDTVLVEQCLLDNPLMRPKAPLADPVPRADLDEDRRRVYSKAMHNVEHLDETPALIVACLNLASPDDANVASGLFGSIFPAAQNMLLAARSRGLGGVLLTLATDYSPIKPVVHTAIRDLLELPDDVRAVTLIPIGYPEGPWGRPWRKPWQECTHWDRWSDASAPE